MVPYDNKACKYQTDSFLNHTYMVA